jgi:hypothetical protein
MKISKEILDQLCICSDTTCTKPHTVKELEAELGEILVDTNKDKIPCPGCKKPDTVSTYVYQEVLEAFCAGCGINFNVSTGHIIDMEDIAEPDIPEAINSSHKMHFDGNFYQCDSCEFETVFMQEANVHEQSKVKVITVPPVKVLEHKTHWSKNQWACDDCSATFPTVTEADKHEKDNKPQEDLHFCRMNDELKKWACIYCKVVFDSFKDAMSHENDAGKKANNVSVSNYSYTKHCTHKPQEVLKGEGWSISAGRRFDCEDFLEDFDIVLNLTGNRINSLKFA